MWIIFSIISLVSIFFIVLFVLRMRTEALKASVNSNSCCFRIFACCVKYDKEAFMEEHRIGVLGQDEVYLSNL